MKTGNEPLLLTKPEVSRLATDVNSVAAGVRHGVIRVPYSHSRSAYGFVPIPLTVVIGALGPGPTALLTGGNHGDEYEGPVALHKLRQQIRADQVCGRIIICPAINWPAFHAGQRTSPIDGGNLNRMFPGARDGSITQMIAHYVEHVLLAQADYVIDFHAGGQSLNYLPLLQMPKVTTQAERQRRDAAACAFGAPISLELDFLNEDRTLQRAAERQGVFWFGAELGGGGSLNLDGLAIAEDGTRRFLRHVGVLQDDAAQTAPSPSSRFCTQTGAPDYLFASASGVFQPAFSLGATVRCGQHAGIIHRLDAAHDKPVEVTWEGDGEVVCIRTLAAVAAGDCLGHLAQRVV
jgi:uncharacterized protein